MHGIGEIINDNTNNITVLRWNGHKHTHTITIDTPIKPIILWY